MLRQGLLHGVRHASLNVLCYSVVCDVFGSWSDAAHDVCDSLHVRNTSRVL